MFLIYVGKNFDVASSPLKNVARFRRVRLLNKIHAVYLEPFTEQYLKSFFISNQSDRTEFRVMENPDAPPNVAEPGSFPFLEDLSQLMPLVQEKLFNDNLLRTVMEVLQLLRNLNESNKPTLEGLTEEIAAGRLDSFERVLGEVGVMSEGRTLIRKVGRIEVRLLRSLIIIS